MTAPSALAAIAVRKRAEAEQLRCIEGALWAKAEMVAPAPDLATTLRGGTVIGPGPVDRHSWQRSKLRWLAA